MFGDKRSFGFSASDSAKFEAMVNDMDNFYEIWVSAYCSKNVTGNDAFKKATCGIPQSKIKTGKIQCKKLNGGGTFSQDVTVACNANEMYILCEELFDISERYSTPLDLWKIYDKL